MSVNYYLDSPHNEAGHLGKWAAGYFTAKAPEGVDSFDAWAAQMDGKKVFAESGYEVTKDKMLAMASARTGHRAAARSPNGYRGEFMDKGALFVRPDFC
jgi:hypothetical protein